MNNNITKTSYLDDIIESIKQIDTTGISDNVSNDVRTEIVDEQKVYFWIRLYLKDENPNIQVGDDIVIEYTPSGEKLKTKFICYDKKGLSVDHQDEITNYNPEDNKKVLCLMVDTKMVNYNDDIPFIRTLFKTSYHYDYQLIRRDELLFIGERNGMVLDYFDVDF
jgi:hypothetical protein